MINPQNASPLASTKANNTSNATAATSTGFTSGI
jgi:hypothetical protein